MSVQLRREQAQIVRTRAAALSQLPPPDEPFTWSEIDDHPELPHINKLRHASVIRPHDQSADPTLWTTDRQCYERIQSYSND